LFYSLFSFFPVPKKKWRTENRYRDPSLWLCRPDLKKNYCYEDITATEFLPDGSTVVVPHQPSENPLLDCFYVYPTVDIEGEIGNHTDFSDLSPMLVPLLNQAARFSSVCALYAPLYRQVTLKTFSSPYRNEYIEIAYNDVYNAFQYYLQCCHRPGRPFLLMGHSQGSILLRMLIQREIENNPELRRHLLVALLIGGDLLVPTGGKVGGSFQYISVCTTRKEWGCVIAYRSYAEGFPPRIPWPEVYPQGTEPPCTNPAASSDEKVFLSGAYFPTRVDFPGLREGVDTPFFLYRNFFTSQCVTSPVGKYLKIGVEVREGDKRTVPFPWEKVPLFWVAGLHMLDYNFMLEDLIRLVKEKLEYYFISQKGDSLLQGR